MPEMPAGVELNTKTAPGTSGASGAAAPCGSSPGLPSLRRPRSLVSSSGRPGSLRDTVIFSAAVIKMVSLLVRASLLTGLARGEAVRAPFEVAANPAGPPLTLLRLPHLLPLFAHRKAGGKDHPSITELEHVIELCSEHCENVSYAIAWGSVVVCE